MEGGEIKMQKLKKYSGFTLIELLVVIAIIGILAAVVLVSLSSARAKSRDARRISDMNQMQTALELFYNDTGAYPATVATDGTGTITCGTGDYLDPVPKDPTGTGSFVYTYAGTGTGGSTTVCGGTVNTKTDYSISFTTEQPSSLGAAGTHTATSSGLR
ncbi:MAG TPA: prepilin-type N-terminal cleavage/methylation domain-containing protein [Patescibacteria group bacterium]|nr:prepilin-type N-terminal cleavage/methylation domain-containing protein [Patescibacteria group bacterium]